MVKTLMSSELLSNFSLCCDQALATSFHEKVSIHDLIFEEVLISLFHQYLY